MKILWDTRS